MVWLLSIPFGPFFGWLCTEQLTAENWRILAGVRAFLCVLVPLICVLPLLRCVRGTKAVPAGLILLIGTAFPVLTGLGSAMDVTRGPVWENVEVKHIRPIAYRVGVARVRIPGGIAELANGRVLRPVQTADVHREPMRLLMESGAEARKNVAGACPARFCSFVVSSHDTMHPNIHRTQP